MWHGAAHGSGYHRCPNAVRNVIAMLTTESLQLPLPKVRMSLSARLRAYFVAGILVTAPFALTAYLVWAVVDFVDGKVMPLIPDRYNPNAYLPVGIPGIGVVVALVLVTAIGALTAGFAGRLLVRFSETPLPRMPGGGNLHR